MPDKSWFQVERNSADLATVLIHDEIGAFGISSGDFAAALAQIDAPNLDVRINSPGGEVNAGIAIYHAIQDYAGNTRTIVDAMAGSIASVILQAGKTRIMRPSSRVMVHNAQMGGVGVAVGYAADFEALAAEATKVATNLRETSAMIADIYAARSGKDAAHFQTLMDAETRLTGQAAVDAGLADEVSKGTANVVAFREAAAFDFKGYREAALIRDELLAEVPAETDAGRTMSAANASKFRQHIDGLDSLYREMVGGSNDAKADEEAKVMSEEQKEIKQQGDEPANPIDARKTAVDAILAGYRL